MNNNLITEEEIKRLKSEPKYLPSCNIEPIIPITLKSGYRVGYSIDGMPNGNTYEHISISNTDINKIDVAEEDIIAIEILGSDYECMGSFFSPNVIHYRKLIKTV